MEYNLEKLGLNEKEIKVYLYLVEYGVSGASEIGKKLNIPKSTINFICDNLWKNGFLKKTFSGNTGFYEIDTYSLQNRLEEEIITKKDFIENIIPKLNEKSKNVKRKPKIKFFDGVENCKKAYLEILKIKGTFFEFGAHHDLVEAFGEKFMNDFIAKRVEKNIFCDSIGTDGEVEINLQKLDSLQKRDLKIFSSDFGDINSSIVIYQNKVLILNLKGVYNGVLIENEDFAITLKTIFWIAKNN